MKEISYVLTYLLCLCARSLKKYEQILIKFCVAVLAIQFVKRLIKYVGRRRDAHGPQWTSK